MLVAGCSGKSDEPVRAMVTGELKFSGQPIKEGMIRFVPENGPSSQGIISSGKFKIGDKGGVAVGACKVEIEAFEETDKKARIVSAIPQVREKEMRESKQIIPEKYNAKTRIKFDVVANKENDFSIDLAP